MTPGIIAAVYTVGEITSTLAGSLDIGLVAVSNLSEPSISINGEVLPAVIEVGKSLIPVILDVEEVAE